MGSDGATRQFETSEVPVLEMQMGKEWNLL